MSPGQAPTILLSACPGASLFNAREKAMTTRFFFRSFFPPGRTAFVCVMLILMATVPSYAGTVELLSDACISDISAGATGDSVITAFYETPTSAYIDSEPRWWGDMDGYGSGCTTNPGYVVTNIPYGDFQYDTFKYSFKNQAEVDRFLSDLPSVAALAGVPINVIATDYIRSNPDMGNFFSGDGHGPRIEEIVITTDQKIDGNYVRAHNGEVITQGVRIDLEFLPPYARTYTVNQTRAGSRGEKISILERSATFRNYDRYEWLRRRPSAAMIRNEDGTISFIEIQDETYNFGAVFLESGKTGDDPILSESGRVVVPPNTTYLKNVIFNDIHVYSPVIGMTIGLAPRGGPVSPDKIVGDQTHYPDLNRYQELGILEIRDLNVTLKGGNDIYIYPNEELDVCK
jgi:hypothetical protein